MPRASLSIRYILFELEEMEREDNFRLKRFKELKIKKQSKEAADKEEMKTDVKENLPPEQPTLLEVKFDDKKEDPYGFIELEKMKEKHIPKKMEKIEESMEKEPNINLNDVQETETNELKNQGEYTTNKDEEKVGNASYFDEPWNKIMDENFCKCSPLFMSTQEVCQAEIPNQSFNLESDKKLQGIKLQKEDELKISKDIPPCSSKILLTWLKKIIEEIISECVCNLRMNEKENVAACSQNIRKYSTEFSKLSVHDSTFSVNSKVEDKLGSFESKYKEIIKVSRLPNEDGTVRQKRKIVTVRTDKRNPMKTKSVNIQNNVDNGENLVCTCSDSSSQSGKSESSEADDANNQNDNDKRPDLFYPPTDTRSEPVCSKCLSDKSNLRSCISAGSMKNTKKMNTITCSYPSDRRVNITISDKGFEQLDSTKESRLPLVSSINVNFCDLPKNILLDLRDCQGVCNETNQKTKYAIDEDLSKITQPKKSASTCMCDLENDDLETAEKCSECFNKVGVEVEAMFKNASTGMTSTAYIFNNVIVTNIKRSDEDRKNTALQSPDFSYIFSKVEKEFKNICKQTCMTDDELSVVFNKIVFKKSIQDFQEDSLTRLKEISDLLKESVRSMNSGKYKFKYVYKNEVNNDMDKKTSTDIIYIYTICDASTSTDDVDCGSNNTGVTTVFKQTCKHRSEYTYFPSEVECRKADVVQRASETTLHDITKIFKDPCNCIFNKIDIKIPHKEDICNMKCGTSDSTNLVERDDLEKPSEILNVVDINTMFKDSCVRKNEFTYVLNKPTNKPSCELARRTTDLRLQQMSKFEDSNKNVWGNLNTTNIQKSEPNQFMKTPNLIKIDNMFKDSCVQKNSFTYVLNNLQDKASCELARRTSDLRLREIEKLSTNSKNSTCGYDTCIVCKPDRCLSPNYIKIDKMVKKACTQKNEFTYVSTKLGKKPVQLARRTSHLRLHEISKINESNSSKTAESEVQDAERSKSDFTCLLRKALESIEMIKSNCEKYRNVATFSDTSMYENDYKYFFNKIDQAKTSDFENASVVKKAQEINKMIKDSCTMSQNPKYDYIFQKVPKTCTCTCNRKFLALKLPCSVSFNNNVYEENKPCNIESQSTCSFVNKRKHKFLIQIPNPKFDSGTLGIEVMWKSGGVADKNIAPKSIHLTTSSITRICPGNSENKINQKKSWCRSNCSKSSKVPSEKNDISLIRRMLDSVKNVYVPFLKTSVSEVNKEATQPKADNVISLISNSTTSTYSWKSCVMKTCQADIECVEKNISYSGFSYGSSLDFVSYKSEGVGSACNSAIEYTNVEESTPCKYMKDSDVVEKLLTFDIDMKSGSSLDTKDSVISVKRSHSIKFDPNVSNHCQKCGRRKNKPKTACSKCSLTQNQQVYRLSKSPIPSCTRRQNKNLLKRSCSCISVSSPRYANEPKADYWYNVNKRTKFKCTSTECLRASEQNVANKCKQPIRKCLSYDDSDCCCSKNSRSFH
ncbi:hypothetical protein RR48_10182 [Papilio machaon]|uniref:Uncharacterized protein n=1 Tax=Papilio machaon TaxID=76193 RepID=A0A194QZX0_PAPMA|nr:hypothetical protein RR48_10182 [Papilio machaon]